MASACRIACVRIGRFATGVEGARTRGPTGAPVVLTSEVRGKTRVVAVCTAGSRCGITVGMALAEAKALAADLIARPYDQEAVAGAACQVTTALLTASPRVAWERGLGVWWVDAAGLGDQARLAERLRASAAELGFGPARCGVADSAIAAYAATIGAPTVVVPPGSDAAFLAPLPIELLDLDEDLAEHLQALGLKTVGQLAALEPGEVEARFGAAGLAAHRLARGLDTRGPTTPRDDALPVAECDLGAPVATTEPLLFVLKGALASLGEALRARGFAARELAVTLALDDGSRAERSVRPARPTSHAGALFDHLRAALEEWTLPEPVIGLALRVSAAAPASGEQGDLLAPRWADPAALEAAFERIRGREGGDAVVVPEARDGHLPADEAAWDRRTNAPTHRRTEKHLVPSACPPSALRLLGEPKPIRVRLGRAGIAAFRHDELWHDVAEWSGPERLAPRWWEEASPAGARDYFTALDRDGMLWLLFRSGKTPAWFLEGWWD